MSTVSGLASKEDKDKGSKQKYSSLNINNLYKGKSLESPKTAVVPKHGLQTLGKVGAIRRIPPPTNLPSLKSENAGNNPNVNLVPSGGQGWVKDKTQEESTTSTTQQATPDSLNSLATGHPVDSCSQFHGDKNGSAVVAAAIRSQEQQQQALMSAITGSNAIASRERANDSFNSASAAVTKSSSVNSRSWSTITSQEEGGPAKSFLAHGSPYFPQEFPELDGGDSGKEGDQKGNIDYPYGQGPSLRPQSEGTWSRGTGSTIKPSVSTVSSSSSTQGGDRGGGSIGVSVPGQGLLPGMTGPVPQSHQPQHMIGTANLKTVGNPLVNNGNVVNGQSVCIDSPQIIDLHLQQVVNNSATLQNFHMFGPSVGNIPGAPNLQQFRSMVPSYLYSRMPGSKFPGMGPPTHLATGYPSIGPVQPNFPRAPYPDPNRARNLPLSHQKTHHQKSQSEDVESSFTERKGIAPAILTDKDLKGFDEILDSEGIDDWVAPPNDIDYNAKLVFSDDEDSAPSHQIKTPAATKGTSQNNDATSKSSDIGKHLVEQRDDSRSNTKDKEREKNDIPKYRPPMAKVANQWPTGAYSNPQESGKSNSDVQSSGSSSLTNYSSTKSKTDFPDDDEMWKQRSRQHSDEMIAAVERARKRREEEEKKFEASRLAALEKAKKLEEKTRLERQKSESREGSTSTDDKENREKENREKEARTRESRDDRSTHSSESHEDKAIRDSQRSNQGKISSSSYGNKPFTKEVPPRFRKQAELQRQLQQLQQLQHHQVHQHKPKQQSEPQTPTQSQPQLNQSQPQSLQQSQQQAVQQQQSQPQVVQQQQQQQQSVVQRQQQQQPQQAAQRQQQQQLQQQSTQSQPQSQQQPPPQAQPQSQAQPQQQNQSQAQAQPQPIQQPTLQQPLQQALQQTLQQPPQLSQQLSQQITQQLQQPPAAPIQVAPQPQPQQLQQLLQQHHQQKQSLASVAQQLPITQHHQLQQSKHQQHQHPLHHQIQHTHQQSQHPQQQLPLHHQYQQQMPQFPYQQSFQHQFSAALTQPAIGAGFIPLDKNPLSEDLFEWQRDFKDNKWSFESWGSSSSSLNERHSNYEQLNHANDPIKEKASHLSPDDKSDNHSDQLKHGKSEDSGVKSSSSSLRNPPRPNNRDSGDVGERRRRESDKIVRKPNSPRSSSRSNQMKDKHSHDRENRDQDRSDFSRRSLPVGGGSTSSGGISGGASSFRGGRREYRSSRLGPGVIVSDNKPSHYNNNDDKYSSKNLSSSSSRKITRTSSHKRSSISESYHKKDERKRKNQIKGDSLDSKHHPDDKIGANKNSSKSSGGETSSSSNRNESKSGNDSNNYEHTIKNRTTYTRKMVMSNETFNHDDSSGPQSHHKDGNKSNHTNSGNNNSNNSNNSSSSFNKAVSGIFSNFNSENQSEKGSSHLSGGNRGREEGKKMRNVAPPFRSNPKGDVTRSYGPSNYGPPPSKAAFETLSKNDVNSAVKKEM